MVPLVSVSRTWSTRRPISSPATALPGDEVGVDQLAREAQAHGA